VVKPKTPKLPGNIALWGKKKCIQGFGGKNLREGDHLKDPGVDGKTILELSSETLSGGMKRIDLA
jgi:hypothetical protein